VSLRSHLREPQWAERLVGLAGALVALVLVITMLRGAGNDPLTFAALGEEDTRTTPFVQQHLGRDGPLRSGTGHDGRYFLVQGWDPLYLSAEHAEYLDDPIYRARRMLFPMVIGAGGLLPDDLVPWSLGLSQIAILGFGSLGAARLAREVGVSPWAGLGFAFNPGLYFEIQIGGSGILALATATWATLALQRGRQGQASLWLMLSVLTREVMLVYAAGLALQQLFTRRRAPVGLLAPSIAGLLVWDVYLRVRLDPGSVVSSYRIVTWPLTGIVEAARGWSANGDSDVLLLAVVIISLVTFALLLPSSWNHPAAGGALGFLVLSVFLSHLVWGQGFDIARGVAPVFTALPILGLAYRQAQRQVTPAT
jgi:hypothetical protein